MQLIGHLGADPELRYTAGGQAVTNFRLAVNRTRRDQQSGQTVDETEWFRVVAWEKLAEIADQYLRKGGQVSAIMWTLPSALHLGEDRGCRTTGNQ